MDKADSKRTTGQLAVISDLKAAAVSDRRIFRQTIAGPAVSPNPLPLVPNTEQFFAPGLAKLHAAKPSSTGHDVACYFVQDAVISGAGQIWLGGRLVTSPEIMPLYVANLLELKNGGSESLHRSAVLPVRTINAPCLVAIGHGIQVYGHFLIEMMFRILVWRYALLASPVPYKILLDRQTPAWLLQILSDYLRISQSDIEFFDPKEEQVLLRNAAVPANLLRDHHFHPFANELLAGLLRSLNTAAQKDQPRRIFVVRGIYYNSEAPRRICVNEQALIDIAAEKGFVPVRPETIAWPEQIALFRDAEFIIGQAGSGLHNALFSSPGSRLASIGFMNLVQAGIGTLRGQHNAFLTEGIQLSGEFRVNEATFETFLDHVLA